jgi:hypothetical protein
MNTDPIRQISWQKALHVGIDVVVNVAAGDATKAFVTRSTRLQ